MSTTLTNTQSVVLHKLQNQQKLTQSDFLELLTHNTTTLRKELSHLAMQTSQRVFQNRIFIRGLIEFSNYCRNDCYYCGIRHSNSCIKRYRLGKEEILSCCQSGYTLGFRTFVLQGGEDPFFTDERMADIIASIHTQFPDCAITLSLGERDLQSYQRFFDAGATRYLLRHETANPDHYVKLHPNTMSYEHRIECLHILKTIGYQVGCGFMVGSPFQTPEMLANDLLFIQDFKPHMVGIGPFISHKDTPFANYGNGTLCDTILLLSILRLMNPNLLLPATTALSTIDPTGRTQGILAGANVVMPNLSPQHAKANYTLYDHKCYTDSESAAGLDCLRRQLAEINYEISIERGDYPLEVLQKSTSTITHKKETTNVSGRFIKSRRIY